MLLRLLKVTITLLATLLAIALVGLGTALAITTVRAEQHINQVLFASGNNDFKLDGPYQISTNIQISNWTGKTFANQNFNIFDKSVKKYPFRLSTGRGLRDPNTEVWRTDYNLKGNPWALRLFLIEEIVAIQNNRLLGKMHVRIMPNLVFTVGYFELISEPANINSIPNPFENLLN